MLEIKNLIKYYGKFKALDGLNLHIDKGELFGFVGPNGAGKTTTMRIISGLLTADGGEVYVDGVDALNNTKDLKGKIGYMPDFFGVYDNLKVFEYMEFYASIYNIVGDSARTLCQELMELVNLGDKGECYVDELSRGMKQRLCLARCLIHNPTLLILDEPASGLDPRARFEMKEILRNLSDMGKTILISSHILPELSEMCTNIGIIEKGKIVLNGAMDEIVTMITSSNPLVISTVEPVDKAVVVLKEDPQVDNLSFSEREIRVNYKGTVENEAELLKKLILNGVAVSSFKREEGNLESLFMQITSQKEED